MWGRSGILFGAWSVAVGSFGLLAFAACGSDDSAGGKSKSDAGSDAAGFGAGTCYSCVDAACGTSFSDCESEPSCAAYLDCVKSCPSTATGSVDPTCEGACPSASGAGIAAKDAVHGCLFGAAAQSCASCGFADAGIDAPDATTKNPILNLVCPPSSIADACNKCQAEKCCDYFDAIQDGSDTSKLADCWLACTTSQCEQDCYAQYPNGIPKFAAWGACLSVLCIAPGTCPSVGGQCGLCTYQQCGLEYADCEGDVECFLALECVGGCNDSACMQACRSAHPSADALFEKYSTCVQLKCATLCGG